MGFSVSSAIRFGWETFKKRPWLFTAVTLLLFLVQGLADALADAINTQLAGPAEDPPMVDFLISSAPGTLFSFAVSTLISMGAAAFYLAVHDNPETVELAALWHPHPFWKYLGTSVLILLGTLVGIVLLIVPGVIFALMFIFAPLIVIDRELGPVDAMKESRRITRGHKWRLLGLVLVFGLILMLCEFSIAELAGVPNTFVFDPVTVVKLFGTAPSANLLGALVFIAALLVLWPIATLAVMRAYRVLSGTLGTGSADTERAA
jgi:uncharacterized membrane protein